MAEWVELKNTNFLTSQMTFDIYNNFDYLADEVYYKLQGQPNLYDCGMPYDTPIEDMIDKFNKVEQNITSIHDELVRFYSDPYYREFKWSENTDLRRELYAGVNRWINWLNNVKAYFDGTLLYYLTDADGKYIIDSSGRYITVYGGYNNG